MTFILRRVSFHLILIVITKSCNNRRKGEKLNMNFTKAIIMNQTQHIALKH